MPPAPVRRHEPKPAGRMTARRLRDDILLPPDGAALGSGDDLLARDACAAILADDPAMAVLPASRRNGPIRKWLSDEGIESNVFPAGGSVP